MEATRKHFRSNLPEALSCFGSGSGSGCIFGAISGGTVTFGLALNDDKKKITKLTIEINKWFKGKYGITCCSIIRLTNKGSCPVLTGEVAGKIAEMLINKQK